RRAGHESSILSVRTARARSDRQGGFECPDPRSCRRRPCSSTEEHSPGTRAIRVRLSAAALWPRGETDIMRDYGSRVGGSIPSEAAALSSFNGKDTRLRTVKCAFDSRREYSAFEAPLARSQEIVPLSER